MGAIEYQPFMVHTRENFKNNNKKENYHHNKKKDKKQKKFIKYPSNIWYYACDEKRHIARDYPNGNKRHHAHTIEDDEPTNKIFRREKDDLDEEYVLISILTHIISHRRNYWFVDSGASKHMKRYKESFINMS